jgi:hypothetical protein
MFLAFPFTGVDLIEGRFALVANRVIVCGAGRNGQGALDTTVATTADFAVHLPFDLF